MVIVNAENKATAFFIPSDRTQIRDEEFGALDEEFGALLDIRHPPTLAQLQRFHSEESKCSASAAGALCFGQRTREFTSISYCR